MRCYCLAARFKSKKGSCFLKALDDVMFAGSLIKYVDCSTSSSLKISSHLLVWCVVSLRLSSGALSNNRSLPWEHSTKSTSSMNRKFDRIMTIGISAFGDVKSSGTKPKAEQLVSKMPATAILLISVLK